ncbi:hypothetical protein [Staphylococcus hominis]|uniref:hypothetical protein n=2 Tax=Staphylococcus hominis TaxID=1290 RepID=UPI001F5AB28C|nr:hypothetical protein [Staphylococcus hominis]MCI2862382.1 hypothetical protein [Staphylococcus hominis]MCI2866329.1 hypothetical protein [Staphylococcus hominis]MCI2883986.1 hypothetical protein [Staphylococcus hominis]
MMFKRILINLIFAELLYLLIKPLIIKLESEDDIDATNDFAMDGDQVDIGIAFHKDVIDRLNENIRKGNEPVKKIFPHKDIKKIIID